MSFKKTIRQKTKHPILSVLDRVLLHIWDIPKLRIEALVWDIPGSVVTAIILGYPKTSKRFAGMGYPNVINIWDIPKCLLVLNFWKQRDSL